jgi:iron complex transport system ATP-binding protein
MPQTLTLKDITYRRGDRMILDGIDWQVNEGEHWVILGPNGCGKTSLINCLTGYEMATTGDITVDGSEFGHTDWREVRKRVGLVTSTLTFYLEPQEPVLDAVVSGRNALLNLVGEIDEALVEEARALLERIGCGYLMNSKWGVLSQGERQKILICRALMADYRVLILDEPCAGLDPVAREQFLKWLRSIAEQPQAPSLVLVTHHVEEILPCFSHVLLLKKGKVLASGAKNDVLNSENLSAAYGASVHLSQSGPHYQLAIMDGF